MSDLDVETQSQLDLAIRLCSSHNTHTDAEVMTLSIVHVAHALVPNQGATE